MTLMDRIKVKDFLSYSKDEKHRFIMSLQLKRKNSVKEAATKKRRKPTGKKKTKVKKTTSKRRVSSQAKAEKLMSKLSDAQLLALMEKLS